MTLRTPADNPGDTVPSFINLFPVGVVRVPTPFISAVKVFLRVSLKLKVPVRTEIVP